MDIVRFRLKGERALMCHNGEGLLDIDAPPPKPGALKKEKDTDEEKAEKAAYRLPDGTYGFPLAAVRALLISASKSRKTNVVGSKRQVALQPFIKAAVLPLEDEFTPILDAYGNPYTKYEIDKRGGRNPNTKQGIVCVRPKFWPWWLDCVFEYSEMGAAVPPDMIEDLLIAGGRSLGIGSFRIQNGGWFGKFSVEGPVELVRDWKGV